MGMQTEMAIKRWQKNAGLSVPDPEVRSAWRDLQDKCFTTIKVAELEMSGIRDGDNAWHGSDVIGAILGDLNEVLSRLMALNGIGAKYYGEQLQPQPEQFNPGPQVRDDMGDEIPF